jgi:SPP1 gp7 family putative phage head morphogenesis protein
MRQLPPLFLYGRYWAGIERGIIHLLDELLYTPMANILLDGDLSIRNSISALLNAIKRGRVWYEQGRFHGAYNSQITIELRSLGAHYDRYTESWELPLDHVPPQIFFAMADVNDRIDRVRNKLLTTLGSVDSDVIDHNVETTEQYQATLGMMEGQFMRTLSGLDMVSIAPKLTDTQRDNIAKEWGTNLNLNIKGWTDEAILKLRADIQPHVLAGGRAEALVKAIQESRGHTKAKARFLARQETSLLMSKFRETRYKDVGINTYRWHGAMDSRERPDHKALEGQVFSWDSPPVVDKRTGRRCHPGEDYGCRCIAIGLVH